MPYVLRRVLYSLILLLLTISFVFLAGRMIGDPALNMLGPGATPDALEKLRVAAGLNDPLWKQYLRYMGGLFTLDFGVSYRFGFSILPSLDLEELGQPVFDIVLERLPATFLLTGAALAIAVPLGVVMGVTAAARPRSLIDRIVTVLSLAGVSIVQFWLGLMLIVLFAVQLGWLPTGGYGEPYHVILPALTLAARPIGRIAQVTRSAMLDELAKPYVVSARAKGVEEWRVIYLHALKNAAIPIVTMVGDETSALLTGAILVEKIFAWPGVGLLIIDSLTRSDLPLIQASIAVVAALVIIVNLLVDLSYRLFKPDIKLDGSAKMSDRDITSQIEDGEESRRQSIGWRDYRRAILRDPVTFAAMCFILMLIVFTVGADILAPHEATGLNLRDRMLPPFSWGNKGEFYLLGTDELGRDLFSRLIYGARVSVSVGVLGAFLSALLGVTAGLLAGYHGGLLEDIVMRLVDGMLSLPSLLVALFVLFILGGGFGNLILVFLVLHWMVFARMARGLALSARNADYVLAARAQGCKSSRIILRHILPNVIAPILVLFTLEIAVLILSEASLSFLGFGVQPPDASWGLMIAGGREHIRSAWWLVAFPGIAIFLTALSLNLIANWARAVTDPVQRWRWLAPKRTTGVAA